MSQLIALRSWLNDAPEDMQICADSGDFTKADLSSQVSFWINVLPARSGQRWALFHDDAIEFLSMLLALWQLGCTVCIPGDNCSATVERLKSHVDGFLGQFDPSILPRIASESDFDFQPDGFRELDRDFPALEIYTSGSTGEPQPILKYLGQIEAELSALKELWSNDSAEVVISTVTHQHLYGLTFRLFWPLCRGIRFERTLCQYSEAIVERAKGYRSFQLISTPAHLSRMNTELDWHDIAPKCEAVLSSAAPLKREDSLLVSQLLESPVREIYGSSETGAIAWRTQLYQENTPWQPLPGVRVAIGEEGLLKVLARHVSDDWLITADRVDLLNDQAFLLLGRADNVYKVEGKRLSLIQLDRTLEQQPYIESAKSVVLTRRRTEIGVVAELSDAGKSLMAEMGRKRLVSELKQYLKHYFEPVLLPRRWRFVASLPYNSQGKLTLDRLMNVFDSEPVKWPEVRRQSVIENTVELVLHMPDSLIYFDGHFKDNPILPGITQVHWAEHYGRSLLNVEGTFVRLEAVKFQQVIFPNTEIAVRLEWIPQKQKLGFRFYSEKGVHSSGRICVE